MSRASVAALAALLAAAPALADGVRFSPAAAPAAYRNECAACHVAYPPSLLPAASWQRLMGGLGRHFGADASLDAATVKELSTWLVANAGTGRRASEPPQDRITRSDWFVREHRKVPSATWNNATVRSAANCAACHTRAEQGDFDEDHVRIPR